MKAVARFRWGGLLPVVALSFCWGLSGCGGGGGSDSGSSSSTTTTFTGSAEEGTADGPLTSARFDNPVNVAVDRIGTVYVCDFDSGRIRRISTGGAVSTLVNQANFSRPFGIAFTPDGRLFVTTDSNDTSGTDQTTGTLWQIDTATGAPTVIARNLGRPRGLVALSNTQLVLADLTQNDIRLINPTTKVITPLAGLRGTPGFVNGLGTVARFNRPYGLALTRDGNILVADQNNNALRLVTIDGAVTTFAGGVAGYRNGARAQARFTSPQDVDIDSSGTIYVSDNGNHRIRRITAGGSVSALAGDGVKGYKDGSGANTRFFGQEGLAVQSDGGLLYVADGDGGDDLDFNRVRRLQLR